MRFGVLAFVGGPAAALPAGARSPVVVELYTAQGCGACAGSSVLIDRLDERPNLLPLTFSVDYWDYLGWADTFARPEFGERQRACANDRRKASVYTPQVIVGGRGEARADETETVDGLIRRAERSAAHGPSVRVSLGAGNTQNRPADVWLIRYQAGPRQVDVRRGENQGLTLTYRNVVRELVRLGGWSGRPASYALPGPARDGLTTVSSCKNPAAARC